MNKIQIICVFCLIVLGVYYLVTTPLIKLNGDIYSGYVATKDSKIFGIDLNLNYKISAIVFLQYLWQGDKLLTDFDESVAMSLHNAAANVMENYQMIDVAEKIKREEVVNIALGLLASDPELATYNGISIEFAGIVFPDEEVIREKHAYFQSFRSAAGDSSSRQEDK